MLGTVIGDWLASEYQAELKQLCHENLEGFKAWANGMQHEKFYGLTIQHDGSIYLDGSCGIECMLRIIEACGFEYQRQYNPRTKTKATTGYLISKIIEA